MSDWTAAQLTSFAGRTVIVTGANSGLGRLWELSEQLTGAEFAL